MKAPMCNLEWVIRREENDEIKIKFELLTCIKFEGMVDKFRIACIDSKFCSKKLIRLIRAWNFKNFLVEFVLTFTKNLSFF